jgi:rhodanese-related sulfurtransferase
MNNCYLCTQVLELFGFSMKKYFALLLAVLGLNTACSQNFENMEVKEFAELIADSNVVILDVRKADEFAEGHIKGAIFIDQFQSDFVEQAKAKLPKDKTIAIYCRSGRRSANAAGKLADIGYKCLNLKGGIIAWKDAGKPVVTFYN